jgi:predicted Zn finger-like uncharacterized protein
MVIECSNCHARYNVDESKIPPAGVKVRCHKCQHIIVIRKEPAQSEPTVVSEPTQPETPPQVPPTPDIAPTVTPPGFPSEPTEHAEPGPKAPLSMPPEEPAQEPEKPEAPGVPTETPFPEAPSEPPGVTAPGTPVAEPPTPEPPELAPPSETPETGVPSAPVPKVEAPPEQPSPPAVEMSEEDKKWNDRARRLAKALASDLILYNQDKVEEGLRNGTLADLLGPEIRRSWEYYCQQIPKHIVEKTDHFKEQLNKIVGKGKELFK